MNTFAHRDQLLDEFRRASNGSFTVVYRALSELSTEKKTTHLDEKDVKARIDKIMKEQQQIHAE